jgi:hypothetical protein
MARTEDLKTFIKNVPKWDDLMIKALVREWTAQTALTMEMARNFAPVASGNLVQSSDYKRAKITKNGLSSSYFFKVPYAKKLDDKRANITLKNPGELSYWNYSQKVGHTGKKKGVRRATRVNKAKKGILGYATRARERNENEFVEEVIAAVVGSFNAI